MSGLLAVLEAEAVHALRETAAQFQRPALLFSGGKDSTCLVHLARKAFHPAPFPFALLQIRTGHDFPETEAFGAALAAELGVPLVVRSVADSIARGRAREPAGPDKSRNALQAVTLLDAVAELGLDALIGGARREEEKARAKERFFSVRDQDGRWDPARQRPELWNLYNGRLRPGEHVRVFPLSNWTELDVWHYVRAEGIRLSPLYFSHRRRCVRRGGSLLLAHCAALALEGEVVEELTVRCRTVGDMSCTGLVESLAATVDEVIAEVARFSTSERGLRADDRVSETAMEDRKRRGYF